ncbi:trafficking protein particle complex subunit 14 isoform X2 [Acanthochromis polyacanthus]|uniref:trafficking protein particle complex subunit 14 isoform X2 n=1 Tax=Acanthochromis polyacanthus TaxID=80966 RepID=UPI002234D365|nr:trafficking protein particle complex subunit 14 isoform X2 [Acanthochromis polyacanthus]
MESQCECFMYFPATQISSMSDAAKYTTLPRRNHVYLGETVQFLLVMRSRRAGEKDGSSGILPWKDLVDSLTALASVCVAESGQQTPGESPVDLQSSSSEDSMEVRAEEREALTTDNRTFRQCIPLLSHNVAPSGEIQLGREQVKFVVTVWKQEEDKGELREYDYLTLLQLRRPTHTFKQNLSTFKTQVSATLDVLPPPSVQCQQMTISGKHLTVLKVLNSCSQEDMCVRDVKILPNYNSSYLPMMPDGSVLIVDNVCHQSAEVTMTSFCRIDSKSSHLPSMLSALEEQNFLFQLHLEEKREEDSSEGLEVPLLAVLQWHTPTFPVMRYISTFYSLPSIRIHRPLLVMTASSPTTVSPLEHFRVKYTLLNNLQDFLAIRLMWNSEAPTSQLDHSVGAVVCRSPLNNLGQCRKGSTLSFTVAFQIVRTGLFEMSQHMKLKLQFTASVSTSPMELKSSPKSSPLSSSPVQHDLSQSQNVSHQHPSRPRYFSSRSDGAMECQAMPPLKGSVGRVLFSSNDHSLIPLAKIAKRQCKVLVLEPNLEAHSRWPGVEGYTTDPNTQAL